MRRARARPDPVSCQSCRTKKLKCNRVQPCSNCTARGAACNFVVPPQQTHTTSTSETNAELVARIKRLESIILGHTGPAETHSKNASDNGQATREQPHPGVESAVSSDYRKRDQDSRLLESIGTREDSILPRLSHGLVFRIKSMHEILEAENSLQHPAPGGDGRPNATTATFPVYRIATLLLQSYESNVDPLCHILYMPAVQSLMRTSYLRISQGEQVLPGQAALLLSLFAIAAYFYRHFEGSEVATTKQDAIHLSKILSRDALDMLDYSRRNTSGTLEDVQASILMSFVTYHLDGFSARGRILTTTAASIARELRLHRLDADIESSVAENEWSARLLIDREVKRRVFWHITSTDWLLSAISGPQEGTYFIHPNHINVKLPRDCSFDDLVLGEVNEPDRGPQPTGMTFFLERVRLSHLCREMADTVPLETCKLMQMPYKQIIGLDKKLQEYISSLPFFFQLDAESRRRTKPLEAVYPGIPVSRYCIITEAHSRRCKLHQRFLLRQSAHPDYAYSRQACLESARAVVEVYEDHRQHDSIATMPEVLGMCVHFTHLALVVMAMDLCFNRDAADAAEIKGQLRAALQVFEDTRNASPLIRRSLSSLGDILRKHKVHLANPLALATTSAARSTQEITIDAIEDPHGNDQMQPVQLGLDLQTPGMALDSSLDDFWMMHNDLNPDSLTWDNLFSALDSRPY